MRVFLVPAFAACFAVLAFAAPKPASAFPAAAALNYSHADAGAVVKVKRYWKRRYRVRRYRPYAYRPYAYRPYAYRPYAYYRPYGYYRPYRRYYRPYYGFYRPYYWRRPGFNIWIGW